MKKIIASVLTGLLLSLGAGATLASAANAQVQMSDCDQFTLTTDANWSKVAGGKVELTGDGAQLTTTANEDQVSWKVTLDQPLPLNRVNGMAYDTKKAGGTNDTALPSYQVGIDTDADGVANTTAIYEPYWQPDGTVHNPPNSLHSWAVKTGKFWLSQNAGDLVAGHGGPPFYTWTELTHEDSWTSPTVIWYGVGQGTYNQDTVALVNKVRFYGGSKCNVTSWKSLPPTTTPPTTQPPVTRSPSGPKAELPLTGPSDMGPKLMILGGAGLLMVVVGGIALAITHRRRDEPRFTSAE